MSCVLRAAAALALAVILLAAGPSSAQQDPLKGVVWANPAGLVQAEQDLRAMKDAGIEAVRSDLIRSEEILLLADTLGLLIYLDLPLSRLPAARMVDTLDYARALIDTVTVLAQRHSAVRGVGLARYADTSDSTVCAVLNELSGRVRSSGVFGVSTYYVTRFVTDDVCSASVDFVLIDVRGADEPAGALRRWRAVGEEGPVGIGSLGVWVRGDTLRGLDVPASPERQARYLERQLPLLLSDTLSTRPEVVFVHRWRDVELSYASTAHDLEHPYLERYGLHTLEGTPRPAMRVVSGIFTGRQHLFAFERGTAPARSTPWSVLLGWVVIASVCIFYALSPRFRHMLPRYFQARFFFRESVREGRDVLLGASTILLASIGVASGLIMYIIADAVRATHAFSLALRWLPPTTQGVIAMMLGSPLFLIILVGCVHVVVLLVWSVVLSGLSRRKYAVGPAQILMLVVWSRWPILGVMVAAMVAASLDGPNPYLVGGIALAWILIEAVSTLRTLTDFLVVTRVPIWLILPAVLLHPFVLLVGVLTVVLFGYQPELTYLGHAILRR